jgi:hypothetical protein
VIVYSAVLRIFKSHPEAKEPLAVRCQRRNHWGKQTKGGAE